MTLTLTRRGSLIIGLSVLAAAAGGIQSDKAWGQAKFEAHYTATLSGLPVGEGTWVIDMADDRYVAAVTGGTTGLMKVFAGGQGASRVRGVLSGGQTMSSAYSSQIKTKHKSDEVQLTVSEGAVKDYKVVPPVDDDPERVPVTDAERRGVTDPMSASIVHMPGTGSPLSQQVCQRNVSIFDGRLRYNLKFTFKRMDTVRADKGYSGPVVVCGVYFAPVAGFIPSRAAIKYLVSVRDAEFWFAPITGTRAVVPFRIQVPTPIGLGAIEATQFVSIPQPIKASIKGAKTQ